MCTMRFQIVRIGLALLVTCACVAHGQLNTNMATGIKGLITVSPARPGPIRAGSEFPNAAPLSNATFTVNSDKGPVRGFTTDAQGRFRLFLSPGHYTVVLAEDRFPKPCGPFEVDVAPGKMTDVEWRCDSGMR
jgi:Carboxypeptidase regulatory-like domain